MTLRELVTRNRSCRRFVQDRPVPMSTLEDLADLARLTASAGNAQPLKYILCNGSRTNAAVFSQLGWAAYLTDWPGPAEGERPAAYILVLHDTTVDDEVEADHGIACQTILLGATEKGLAGCIIGSINRDRLARDLEIPDHLRILLALALGEPREQVALEELLPGGDHRYWRDSQRVHHVPKRRLADIVLARRTD